jgi:hypothetical protein
VPALCANEGENCDCEGETIIYAQKYGKNKKNALMMDEA